MCLVKLAFAKIDFLIFIIQLNIIESVYDKFSSSATLVKNKEVKVIVMQYRDCFISLVDDF